MSTPKPDPDAHRRESPVGRQTVKTDRSEPTGNATHTRTAGRDPRQEIARQHKDRDSDHTTRSHKSIFRLTGSPSRTDSRQQLYSALEAWPGQDHA